MQDKVWDEASRIYGFAAPPDPITLTIRQTQILDGIVTLIRERDAAMNHIDPRRSYPKTPDRVFTLKQDVLVPAGTTFRRAPLERGGADTIEGFVRLGPDATAYLNVPLRVAEVDAAEWFEEDKGEEAGVL